MNARWLAIAPLILVAACSRSHQPYPEPQPGQPSGAANLTSPTTSAANLPPAPNALPTSANPEPVAPRPNDADSVDTTEPNASSTLDRAGFVIPSGTPIHVRLDSGVDTRANRAGDGFTATLSQPIQVNGRAIVPAGTRFGGHLTTAAASGRFKGRAAIGLRLDSFRLNGRRYELRTTSVDRVSAAHKKRNAVLIGGGSALGAAIGAIAGGGKGALIGAGAGAGAGTVGAGVTGKKEVGIPAETPLRFTLRAPVSL